MIRFDLNLWEITYRQVVCRECPEDELATTRRVESRSYHDITHTFVSGADALEAATAFRAALMVRTWKDDETGWNCHVSAIEVKEIKRIHAVNWINFF